MVKVSIKKRGNIYHAKVQDGFATVRFTLKNWEYVKGLISLVKYLSVTNKYLPPHCFGYIKREYDCFKIAERSEYGCLGGDKSCGF